MKPHPRLRPPGCSLRFAAGPVRAGVRPMSSPGRRRFQRTLLVLATEPSLLRRQGRTAARSGASLLVV